MKKRIFSLLLALAMVLSLLPAGALAADGEDGAASAPALQTQSTTADVTVDGVDEASGDIKQSDGVNRNGTVLTTSNTDVTLPSGQHYIVQNDVTIDGDLTVDGSQNGGLILCAGATLTVTGALIHTGGSAFFIYGQTAKGNSQSTGKLIIQNSNNDDGAAIRSTARDAQLSISSGKVTIYGGSSDKLVEGVQLYSTSSVHKATTLDGEAIALDAWKGKTSLSGKTLVLEYCDHDHATYERTDGTHHKMHCADCGFVGTAVACGTDGYIGCVSDGESGHYQKCPCGNTFGDLIEHTIETVALDGTYHSSGCLHCDYIQGSREPHIYEDGVCKMCGFMPVASTDWEDYASVQEAMDALVKDKVQNGTIKLCPSTTDKIVYEEIVFNYPGQQITLNMNGYALVSGTGTPITVEAGTLNITGAAAIQNTGRNESAAPAILVEGGTLIFNDTVTATGGSGSNNAAPAIKVTGGKVVFHGKVTATGGLKTPGGTGNLAYCQPAIDASGGQLEFNGELDLNGGLTLTGDAKLTNGLTQGTFRVAYTGETVTGDRVSVTGSSVYKNVNNLLADNRIFVKLDPDDTDGANDKYLIASYQSLGWNVTIMSHTHTWQENNGKYECSECGKTCYHEGGFKTGKCEVCGKACPHPSDQPNPNGHVYCGTCGAQLVAHIQTDTTEWSFFTSLVDAMSAAKDGQTIKLRDDVNNDGQYAIVTGDNKTVTLELNGNKITGGWMQVGIDRNWNNYTSTTLKVTGSGSILTTGNLSVGYNATLDLSGWGGGAKDEISKVSLAKNGNISPNPESTLIVSENIGHIGSLGFFNWPSAGVKSKLNGGSYGAISIVVQYNSEPFGSLLAPGYAFQYTESGNFEQYTRTATNQGNTISNVKVVRCAAHVDADNNQLCDYCNTDLTGMAASVTTAGTGSKTYFFSDLADAFKAVADKKADGATVTLLSNVTVSEGLYVYYDQVLDLNGFTIDGSKAAGGTQILITDAGITLTVCDSSTEKTGAITNSSNGWSVYAGTGTLNVSGGSFGSVFLSNTSTVSGGTFDYLAYSGYSRSPLGDALAEGLAFAEKYNTSTLVNAYGTASDPVTYLSNVTVVPHPTHTGSPCACGFICEHKAGMNESNGKCKTCGNLLAVASVTAAGEAPKVSYYREIGEAFNAVKTSNGGTLKLLQNVTLAENDNINIHPENADPNFVFTVDWNGHTLSGNT